MIEKQDTSPQQDPGLLSLLINLRILIRDGRHEICRSADVIHVRTCWEIGRHIIEFEQGGSERATYGKRLLEVLARTLTVEFGRGFDASNLRYMRHFIKHFQFVTHCVTN